MQTDTNIIHQRKAILIVEDSPTQAETLKYSLEKRGNRVAVATNGFEAMDYLETHEAEMVISDIVMPGMDGYELCSKIKSDQKYRSMPVILLTSLTDPHNIIEGLNCSADNFILKPYDEEYLLSQVEYIRSNHVLRDHERSQFEVKIFFGGQLHSITSDRLQILDLLMSTYENAVHKNYELERVRQELSDLNARLEQLVKDRTADLTAEIAIRKRTEEELIAAKQRAEESNHLKTTLLANMSHEFRTPMNGILGFSNILESQVHDPDLRTYVGHIRRSGMRLLTTLNSIMDYSQLESGSMKVYLKDVDLSSLLRTLVPRFETYVLEKKIQLNFHPSANPVAGLDHDLVVKAISNLIDNAIKFTSRGSVNIDLNIRYLEANKPWAVIRISDTGIGITPDKLSLIFEEFRQGSEGYSRSYEGTGLGLTISNKIVALMNGKIEVESTLGMGSVFTVYFPANQVAEEIKSTPYKEISRKEKVSDKLNLLLVEDNPANQMLVDVYINRKYNLDIVADGHSSIDMASRKQYDAILMDINLGSGIDGLEAANEIRKLPGYAETPVVALTGYTESSEKERILNGGCSHYLSKPFSKEGLLGIINEIFEPGQVAIS